MVVKYCFFLLLTLLVVVFSCEYSTTSVSGLPKIENRSLKELEQLGKELFFDEQLSNPVGQSCATCHAPQHAFADPEGNAVSTGVLLLSGTRNAPSVAYAAFVPDFSFDPKEGNYFGGLFWDGRASNLRNQIEQPLMNHLEMNNADRKMVVDAIRKGPHAKAFKRVFGQQVFVSTDKAFYSMLKAIEAYERSSEVNPFSSKFDAYLAGKATLTAEEKWGMELFNDPKKGNCAACHPSTEDPASKRVLFTDFTYDNLGVPAHPLLVGKQPKTPDTGLGKITGKSTENGKFKVPSLRNVALTGPYFHNGSFSDLEEVVEFYNSRNTGAFGKPEVRVNVNNEELGNLQLTKPEVKAIVRFLHTLTDGYVAGR